jgi:predicted DCC family thiol-disulfide oxidoreductase YuxK
MSVSLPSPAELPQADVVIYDGECQFCQKQVARLHAWDGRGRLAFLSLHDPLTRQYCPNLSHEQLLEQMYVVDPQGRQYGGAAAFRYLSLRLPRLWPLAPLMYIPFSLPVWQWLYRQVAVRRYRWNKTECENGTCRIHHH